MHLKRLILNGFKSFADRTSFDFERDGLSCIVGPNGCGKSNVFEAVKWVLGEQRPTSLRSRELTDVIFNGTVRRPPMGLCEASLVFDNGAGVLPTDAEEVTVTRRVFRTGDTEYLLNGSPVRLKDVRDLFAGTGLGAGGYAFMEQGKIDQVLAANPLERRKVFEEAAGISRFRTRKRETELKLNRVEDNLTRLHDIVEEISRQIRSLKIHAGKARSYREMTTRVRELQLGFSLHRYGELQGEGDALATRLLEQQRGRTEKESAREALRERMRAVESELEGLIEGVSVSRTRYAEVKGAMSGAEEKLELQSGYAEEAGRRLQVKTEEIGALREMLGRLDEERTVGVREREGLDRDRDRVLSDQTRQSCEVEELRARGLELEGLRSTAADYLRDLEQRESALREEEARLASDQEHLDGRAAVNATSRERLDRDAEELRAGLEDRTGRQDEQTSQLEQTRLLLTEEERRAEALEQGFSKAVDEVRKVGSGVDRAEARIDVLDGVLARGEGLKEGTRALMEERDRDPSFLPGFRGLLLDLVDVDLDHAQAIQAALGDAAEALVVASVTEALDGLAWLDAQGLSGAHFLALDAFLDSGPSLAVPEGVSSGDDDVRVLLASLLRGLDIVAPEAFADRLRRGDGAPLLVATDGSLWREEGPVAAPPGGAAAQGLVVLRAELEDHRRRLPELVSAYDAARQQLESVQSERDASRARIKKISVTLVNEEGDAARLDQEIVRIVRELDRTKDEGTRLVEERARVEKLLEEAGAGLSDVAGRMSAIGEDATVARNELESHRLRSREHAGEIEKASAALEEVRIDGTRIKERLEALAERERHLLASAEDTKRRVGGDEDEVLELEKTLASTSRTMEEEREALECFRKESETVAEELAERQATADGVRDRLRAAAEELDVVEKDIGALQDELSSLRGREGELRASMDNLLERTRDEMQLDLTDAEARARAGDALRSAAGDEAGEGEGDEAAAAVDWKAVESEIRRLRDRIARLGNVNLAAVEELEVAEERAGFIFKERDDLLDGREQLTKILAGIETQSTDLFVNTFSAVREHFSQIFRKLFGGGKADIFIEDESSPLESGIEIKARPPGKEFRSITLLSGGERTMTAVALLFAIFRANPAPCAFLDEVDAALDEDNTDRFTRMLDDFGQRSQFVVVTHSKRTMERADLMYGVTMPERGVSRRIAVRIEQMGSDGRIRDLAAVEKAASVEEETPAAAVEEQGEVAPAPKVLEVPAMVRRASRKKD